VLDIYEYTLIIIIHECILILHELPTLISRSVACILMPKPLHSS